MGMTTREKNHKQIADAIVRRLYTNGFGERAGRLVLLMGSRDLGGWCEGAVRDIVLDELARPRKVQP